MGSQGTPIKMKQKLVLGSEANRGAQVSNNVGASQ